MSPSRPAILIALVVAVSAVTWVMLRFAYSSLPPLPWTAVPSLLLLALGELVTAIGTRNRILRRPGTRPIEPLVAARLAALAKASAHAAAVFAGVFGGFVVSLATSLDKEVPRNDFVVSIGTFVAAGALIGAALFLEYACRVPKDPEDEDQRRQAPRS